MPTADRHDAGRDEIARFLTESIAARCHVAAGEIDPDRPLAELGMTSRDSVAIVGELEDLVGRALPTILLYEYPTITALARELAAPPGETTAVRSGPDRCEIAVVGLGCRLPGGIAGPGAYWDFLLERGDAIREVPDDRWEDGYEPASRLGGFLDDVAGFDSRFFGITPDEADAMDPQQRLLLEVAWEALEHAGIAPASLHGSRTSVFAGISVPEYAFLTAAPGSEVSPWTTTGGALSIAANRLSYLLDLRGPSMSIDTACSSSLVATHLAVRSLGAGESDLAIVGGVNVLLSPMITLTFEQAGGTAPDGRCKAFDASANGMVRSEGCGVVVLKRLGDAHRDGDRVLAVIRDTGINSDGRSNGLVAPNPEAQEALLREVYSGLEAPDYVEAHGTGTLLGDPIEAHALGTVLGRDRATPLLIGSVKSNLGHLEPASGVASLIKTVLALWHRTIPPSLHYHRPNPHIDFEGLGLKVVAEQTPWPPGPGRAGVSAFGFGGANAHVVLAAAPAAPWTVRATHPVHTLLLSDVSPDRVTEYAGRLADGPDDPAEAAHTLARRYGRGRFGAAVVGRASAALTEGLRALAAGRAHPAVVTGVAAGDGAPVWVFSGYGAQRPGMARTLLTDEPAFGAAIELLEPLVQAEAGFSVWEALDGAGEQGPAETMITLFAVQVGLARLWQAYGVEPAAVIGHSSGEVAAAVMAGALSLRDGVKVITVRAQLLAGITGGGAMAVLGVPGEEIAQLCAGCPDVYVAVLASPRQTVITGAAEQIAAVIGRAERRGLLARRVRAEGAGHSPQVEPLLDPLRQRLEDIHPTTPRVAFYTTTLGDPWQVPVFDRNYWAANLRNPVRLAGAVGAAVADGHRTFVEVSAHPLLAHALADTAEDALILPTLRRGPEGEEAADDTVTFHTQLAALRISGLPVQPPADGQVRDVPSPPWRHEHHWTRARATRPAGHHPLLGAHVELPSHRHAWSANVGGDRLPWLTLHGTSMLPAAAYAEIALAAGAAALGTEAPVLTGLRLERLLPLDDDSTITTTCTPMGVATSKCRIEIQTRTIAGGWTPLATATVTSVAGETAGRTYTGRTAILPAERGDRRFRVHPIVLDRCLASFGAEWTTVAIGRLRVPGATGDGGSCEFETPRPRADGSAVAALRLVNEAGTVLLEARDVELRRIPAGAVPVPLSAKLVEAAWEPAPAPAPRPPDGNAAWLVLSDLEDADAAAIADGLGDAGRYVIRRRLEEEFRETGSLDVVVVVPARLGDEALLLALSGLVRTLPPVNRLWILTRRTAAVRDGEAGEPGQSFVRSLTRVLAFEHSALRATFLDVDDPASALAELLGGDADTEVAWRDGVRYTSRLRTVRLGGTPVLEPVRHGGAYLISGGYGGLGLVAARRLAERGAGRLVLSGRSGPGPAAQQTIEELRAFGTEVAIVLGDIAAPGVAERMVAAARRNGLRLRGVVHAAGVLDDRLVNELGPEDLRRVWSPKVDGAVRLHEATRRFHLDWWLVYSSAAALLGSPGQAAYAAANARTDAFVDWRRAHGLTGGTINWGPWAEVGGVAGLTVAALDPITPEEGGDALEALLAHDRTATGVIRFNVVRALAAFPEIRHRPYFAALVGAAAGAPADDDWPGPEALRDADGPTARRLVNGRVRARVSAVLGFPPDPSRPLTELGLDSLVAVRIKSTLEHDLGVTVAASDLLSGRSLEDLQDDLCRRLGLPETAADPIALRHVVRPITGAAHRPSAEPKLPPFFCLHPAGGDTGVYRQLATLLGEDLPFLGLDRFRDAPEVEERADRYIAMIRAVQPQGPYRLGGWSFGGVLAYEIARRIGGVELVALIDAGVPKKVENPIETTARRYADFGEYLTSTYGVSVRLGFEELAALGEDQQLALVMERTKPVMEQLPPAVAVHQFTSHQDTRALERYRPGPYYGRVVLYRSTEPTPWAVHDARYDLDEANGFGELCPDLEIVPIPGAHHLNLLDPPAVRIIADHLGEVLRAPRTEPA
ncbi:hypothetical protein GCM10027176_26310 [Actinoallomurus bryophytorum]|nr:type I polyketide synthase [Actinoallomurus bryophytorum]